PDTSAQQSNANGLGLMLAMMMMPAVIGGGEMGEGAPEISPSTLEPVSWAVDVPNAGDDAAANAGANSGNYGVAFFGKSNLGYYTANNATLGTSGNSFFFMPLEDSAAVTNASDAARLTGNAPSALDAYMNQGDIYG
ncbi:hypothetical protein, partial [Staphylococcus aureus]|uniref:hypothetical protein n=1 Tax=Staphylococcus aureus TaxID=1280 RepID=UPI0039BE1D5C